MRYIVYHLMEPVNVGTPQRPVYEVRKGRLCVLPYSRKNWELACSEAWGEVEVEVEEEERMDNRE